MKIVESSGLLTPQEAANYLGVKLSTIYSMCMRRQIPFCKIGRLNRFKLSDLEAFINQNRCEATNNEFSI